MQQHSDKINSAVRAALLMSILTMLYIGPASALGLGVVFDDELVGGSSITELLIWTAVVWLFAIPLILAYKWWDSNADKSTVALGAFLGIVVILWMVLQKLSFALTALALTATMQLWHAHVSDIDDVFSASMVISIVMFIIIPTIGIAFQLSRRKDGGKLKY